MLKNKELINDHKRFISIIKEAAALRQRKLHDYGASYRNFGILGIVVRLSDKQARMVRLVNDLKPKNESLRDTFIDMANYAIMGIMLLDEKNGDKK